MTKGKLKYKAIIEGSITLLSGLHISGGDAGYGLAGGDLTVLRNAARNPPEPFIPGSSLKGKLRALYERAKGEFGPPTQKQRGVAGPSNDPASISGKLFGTTLGNAEGEPSAARLVVYDCHLSPDSAEKLRAMKNLDRPYTEVKREAAIDRVTAIVTPREIERVVEGAIFDMKLALTLYEGDDATELAKALAASIGMLNDDYIGGHGSRGYGRAAIKIKRGGLTVKDAAAYEEGDVAKPASEIAPELELALERFYE